MKELFERSGVILQAESLKQKRYGCSEMEPISVETFLAELPHCPNTDNIAELCRSLQKNEVFEIREVDLNRGESMPSKSYIMISTHSQTFVVSGGRSYSSKVVFSHDGEEIFEITNRTAVTVIIG